MSTTNPPSGSAGLRDSGPAQDAASQDGGLALVASPVHTARFVAVLLGVAILIAVQSSRVPATPERSHVAQYLALLAFEWALFAFAWLGLRRRGTSVRAIIGGRWRSAKDVLATLMLSAGFWIVALVVLAGMKRALDVLGQSPVDEARRTQALMAPHGVLESALWVILSASAGFCEEFVFRGYLQRQLAALTRRPAIGIAASALIFGIGHAYQGWRSVIVITVYGLLFGLLAHFSRSLRPGMVAHACQDTFSGLISGLIHR